MSLLVILLIVFSVLFLIVFLGIRVVFLFNYKLEKVPQTHQVEINQNFIVLRDGETLDSYLFVSKKTKTLLIFFHGFGAHLHEFDWLKEYCKKRNYSLILPSRRHSGKNIDHADAKYNLGIEADDFTDIVRKAQQMFSQHQIIVLGHSLGAGLLAEMLGRKETQKLKAKFVLINTVTRYGALNPTNFINKTWVDTFRFWFAVFWKANIFLKFQPWVTYFLLHCCQGCNNQHLFKLWKLFEKYKSQPEKLKQKFSSLKLCVRKFPFYYFSNFLSLFYYNFRNLSKNKVNQIWIVQGEKDDFADLKRVQTNNVRMKTIDNCHFLYFSNFEHGFFAWNPHQKYWQIFDTIINSALSQKTK